MLALSRGADSLVLMPNHGGAIAGWTRDGQKMLRRPSPEAMLLGWVGEMGCFPLVPYANRIAHRRFVWAGKTQTLAANFGDRPHAIHGVGWRRAWQVEAVTADAATLSLMHEPDADWPFAFAARLTYRLAETGLTVAMEATNRAGIPAPMGLGLHPYFPRAPDSTIAFAAHGVWTTVDGIPAAHTPIPPDWAHETGRRVDAPALDHCFTGWNGTALAGRMRIEATPIFGNLQVYTPSHEAFFCVEPVSHVPDALNRTPSAGQGMHVLAPGETLAGTIAFSPEAVA